MVQPILQDSSSQRGPTPTAIVPPLPVQAYRYGDEATSDTVIHVGRSSIRSFHVHRVVLIKMCPALQFVLQRNDIALPDYHPDVFEHFIKFAYGEQSSLKSVTVARGILDLAWRYRCYSLLRESAEYLHANLTGPNVLYVLKDLVLLCGPEARIGPTAPFSDTPIHESEETRCYHEVCRRLLEDCLLLVDEQADSVLASNGAAGDLSTYDWFCIATRDSLRLRSELVLFKALEVWSQKECSRFGLPPTIDNKYRVFSQVRSLVRYGLMSKKEFHTGPVASGLLDNATISELGRYHRKEVRASQLPYKYGVARRVIGDSSDSEDGIKDNCLFKVISWWAAVFD